MNDLQLERLWVVHQGTDGFEMRPRIEALPIGQLDALRGALRAGAARASPDRSSASTTSTARH